MAKPQRTCASNKNLSFTDFGVIEKNIGRSDPKQLSAALTDSLPMRIERLRGMIGAFVPVEHQALFMWEMSGLIGCLVGIANCETRAAVRSAHRTSGTEENQRNGDIAAEITRETKRLFPQLRGQKLRIKVLEARAHAKGSDGPLFGSDDYISEATIRRHLSETA